MKFSIEKFDPLTASDRLWDIYFDFLEDLSKEVHPFDPFPSREKEKSIAKDSHPNFVRMRWIIFPEKNHEKIIGRGMLDYYSKNHPTFEENQHLVHGRVDVAKPYRRAGIGTDCLKTLVKKSQSLFKTVFQSDAILPSGLSFCSKLGGSETMKNTEYRLYFKDVDWNMMQQWQAKGKENLEGVTLESHLEIPDKNLSEWAAFVSEVVNQAPIGGIEGRFKATPESVRLDEKRLRAFGIQWIRLIAKNKDGAIVGTSDRSYNPEQPFRTGVVFTGVKDEWRKRGLCKWLKAEMLFHIRNKYPTVEYEITGAAYSNAPMLSINERMGFKSVCTKVFYKFDLSDLSRKLRV